MDDATVTKRSEGSAGGLCHAPKQGRTAATKGGEKP